MMRIAKKMGPVERMEAHRQPSPMHVPVRDGPLARFLYPSGSRGEHRRSSFVMALIFCGTVGGAIGARVVLSAVSGELSAAGLRDHGILLAAIIPVYFGGCWLAGAAWDATRGIRHRLAGYVLRGAATAGALYGSAFLALPLLEDLGAESPPYPLLFVAMFAVLGGVVGAVKWMRDLLTRNLPEPARD